MADENTINRAEAWEFEWKVLRKNAYTGTPSPIDEDSTVATWLSLTYKGAPITDSPIITLARRERQLRADGRELWFGILAADDVTDALAAIATDGAVFEVCEIDGERKARELVVAD